MLGSSLCKKNMPAVPVECLHPLTETFASGPSHVLLPSVRNFALIEQGLGDQLEYKEWGETREKGPVSGSYRKFPSLLGKDFPEVILGGTPTPQEIALSCAL